jgi:hypothetical protein
MIVENQRAVAAIQVLRSGQKPKVQGRLTGVGRQDS